MNMKDGEILDQIHKIRNHSKRRITTYNQSVKIYTEFNNLTLQELLTEAENEEEKGIRWKKRTLKTRLIQFRIYLVEHYNINTAKLYLSTIQTIYKHYEIEIHELPFFSEKSVIQNAPINYDDLPTKKILQDALNLADPLMRAIILFMSSSGCARKETLNLTIQDFINATKEYHQKNNIYEVIRTLKHQEDVVPTFQLRRQKTNKYYYTFCSPEATSAIISYLQTIKKTLKPEDKLFEINLVYFNKKFKSLNNQLGLNKIGGYNRLRSHMLRKYHASNLSKNLSMDQVDALQGRSKGGTRRSYFMDDPSVLKEIYINNLDLITINQECNTITFESPEFKKLKNENERIKSEIDAKIATAVQEAVQEFWGKR